LYVLVASKRFFGLTVLTKCAKMVYINGEVLVMATETFYKRIILSDEAAMKLADGLDEPREPHVPHFDVHAELKRGEELLKRMSELRKYREQTTN
jgi:hypothetical protein